VTGEADLGGAAAAVPAADDAATVARHRHVLRLALGTSLSLLTAEMLDWELSFLITVFVVQLLAPPGRGPGLRQGAAVAAALAIVTGAAATVSTLLVDMPALFAVVLGLVLLVAFVLQRSGRGAAALGTLIVIAFGFLPVVAVQAPELVPDVAFYLVRGAAVAVLWVWLLHALLPEPGAAAPRAPEPGGATPPPANVVGGALVDAAVLLPVILVAMTLEVAAALVIVLAVTAIVSQHDVGTGWRVAAGLLLSNLIGGAAAAAAYQVLSAVPTPGFLAALLLLVGLLFARAIVAGGTARAPLYVTALITFVIVFGMGIAPFLDEPGATLAIRVRNLAIAYAYAFAALGLVELAVGDRRRTRREAPGGVGEQGPA
jgi:hypothetical protein